jgi:4-hydroxy-3-polyprenylbenzoate decarboxylase
MFQDLREFIKKADEVGECQVVEGADWELEIGAVGDLKATAPDSPLIVFDKNQGVSEGISGCLNAATSQRRIAMAYGLSLDLRGIDLVRAFRDRLREGIKLTPPVMVSNGPVKENVVLGDDVDLYKFPSPKWRELDGADTSYCYRSYLSDPDSDYVNLELIVSRFMTRTRNNVPGSGSSWTRYRE